MVKGAEPARRDRLSRDRVLGSAIALADRDGIEALSMRNLAEGLGVVAMALYKHVVNKDDLLDGMVDLVFAEADFSPVGGWRAVLRERAICMRTALRRHPWAVGLMESGTPGPANLRHHNAVMGCLRERAKLSFPMAVHAYSAMDSYIYGFALQERTLSADIPAEAQRRRKKLEDQHLPSAADYPYLLEIVTELTRSGYDFANEFEFGLDLLLDGIQRMRDHELNAMMDQGE